MEGTGQRRVIENCDNKLLLNLLFDSRGSGMGKPVPRGLEMAASGTGIGRYNINFSFPVIPILVSKN